MRICFFSITLAVAVTIFGCQRDVENEDGNTTGINPSTAEPTEAVAESSTENRVASATLFSSNRSEPEEHEHGGFRMRRGPGRTGRGPGGMGGNREDMMTIHSLFDARDRITRTVKELPGGAEAITESDEPEITELIQTHVPAMETRIHEDNPLPPMTFHPIFVALRKHAEDYSLEYDDTDKGVKVTYAAKAPFVVMLVQEHAKLVSRFIKNGMEEIHKPYKLPDLAATSNKGNVSPDAASPAARDGDEDGSPDRENSTWLPLPQAAPAPKGNPTTAKKIELGKKLYFDPRLSLTGTVSCNSCHNVMEGGDDGRPSSMGILGRLRRRRLVPRRYHSGHETDSNDRTGRLCRLPVAECSRRSLWANNQE